MQFLKNPKKSGFWGILGPRQPQKTYKKNIYIKLLKNIKFEIKKKSGLGGVWSNFGSGLEFCMKNCIYYLVQIHFSSIFEKSIFFNSVFRYFSTF